MIALSALDEARFGIRTAKVSGLTEASLPEVLQFCEREAVRFLIARCPASDLPLVHQLERNGFLLMDTLVYYRHTNLADTPATDDPADGPNDIVIRPVQGGEETLVRSLAEQAFHGYQGHYHADPRLNPRHCDEAYSDWAVRCCTSQEAADEVLVAESLHGLVGLITLKMRVDEGEGLLLCVASHAHRRGIARQLVIRAMEWSLSQGAKQFVISTQITNVAVQKVWARAGLEATQFVYTFHRWFD
jgi:GNAT superfamily N-acetyltransferase